VKPIPGRRKPIVSRQETSGPRLSRILLGITGAAILVIIVIIIAEVL
jgi:hypothetical protein